MSMAAEHEPAPQFDWSARIRSTASEALRYSRFVFLAKRVLSAGRLSVIIAAVLAFFFRGSASRASSSSPMSGWAISPTTWPWSSRI